MKTLTRSMLVLAIVLMIAPATWAAGPAPVAPAAQPAIDAPVVEMMALNQQPVFANLQAPEAMARICIDSVVHCNTTADCEKPTICGPDLGCICKWNGFDTTCQICP